MKELGKKELRDIQLSLLGKLDNFCRKNGIPYYLSYGSLLGAIRHGGFIPWDDDIDVSLARKDYNKLISELSKRPPEGTKILSLETDKNYVYPFAKIAAENTELIESCWPNYSTGVYVDIFPVDSLPENKFSRKLFLKFAYMLLWWGNIFIISKKKKPKNLNTLFRKFASKFVNIIFFWANPQVFLKLFSSFSQLFSKKDSKYCLNIAGDSAEKIMRSEIFKSAKDIKFENIICRSFCDADSYLKIMYGDYMKLPPENKRIEKHDFKAWKAD